MMEALEPDELSPGLQDLHAHTDMSDGDLPLHEVAAIARALGVQIGIADHISTRNPARFVSDAAGVRRYLAALDGEGVLRAGEFCWCDTLWSDLPRGLLDQFDYRIGSNHGFWLPDGTTASPWWARLPAPWDRCPNELMEIMVLNLCDLVRTMPVDIVAHSTLLPPALLEVEGDLHAWWTEEREDRFVEAVAESGVAIEISNRYRLPHDRLLVKAREAGARFSLGSDGHHRSQIAQLGWALRAAARAGITPAEMFVAEPNSVPAL